MKLQPDQIYTLFMDNPNLNNRKLSQLTGIDEATISRKRQAFKGNWVYKGVGLPFIQFNLSKAAYVLRYKNTTITEGSLANALVNLDRLVYCLDNNNGMLPLSSYVKIKSIFNGLTFIKETN